MDSSNWCVYIVECSDETYYTGITNNLEKRIRAHNTGRGAKYTRGRGPVKLVWEQQCDFRSTASQIEHLIKQLSRKKKERLVRGASINADGYIDSFHNSRQKGL